MRLRIFGDHDHPDVAWGHNNVAHCLQSLGRPQEALTKFEAALAMRLRLYGDRDHPDVAQSHNNVARCLQSLGRAQEALPKHEAALAMRLRIFGDLDHPDVALCHNNVALCLQSLGRAQEALPKYEAALAMWLRLYGDRDHPNVAMSHNNVAYCLESLGRAQEALPKCEAALAMWLRLYGDRDHPRVATRHNNLAYCLQSLGRAEEALPKYEAALAMSLRLYGDRDHPDVAESHNNVAACLHSLGRAQEALPKYEAALAMKLRLFGDRDHPEVARSHNNVAGCLESLGRAQEALPKFEAALAMWLRLYGDHDHPDVAMSHNNVAYCLESLGRAQEALPFAERSANLVERLRTASKTLSAELQQSYFDKLKRGGVFERLQSLQIETGDPLDALASAERSRGRQLLDLLEQQFSEPLDEAERRAKLRGDTRAAARIVELRAELQAKDGEDSRLLHELSKLTEGAAAPTPEHDVPLAELRARMSTLSTQHRQLYDERARLIADVLPVGRPRTVAEIQGALRADECLLEFTVDVKETLLYVVPAASGEVAVHRLPAGSEALASSLAAWIARIEQVQISDPRGRDAGKTSPGAADTDRHAHKLFTSLIPDAVWQQIKDKKRVFIAAHRALHRLPFETLVVGDKDGKPLHWLDVGPAIAYVPSGSALHWLRQQRAQQGDDHTALDLLAVGNPRGEDAAPLPPEQGTLVAQVNDGGEGARIGLRAGDVLTAYDGKELIDATTLSEVRKQLTADIEEGTRKLEPVALRVWRAGTTLDLTVNPGLLGIQVGQGKARSAWEAAQSSDTKLALVTRKGDLERLGKLPPLRGAVAEVQAVARTFAEPARVRTLFGADAKEATVRDLAAQSRFVHFACHGIAEEYAGQSLSMLILSQPKSLLSADTDDGFLKLSDLLHHWRGRLGSTQLVVLSACRTNVGPTQRDEAPFALPIGFLFAGASSVISSLWAVDDASTAELMADFYQRLAAGATDRLAAFTAARKALRQKHPEPFYWAPFLYIGSPE